MVHEWETWRILFGLAQAVLQFLPCLVSSCLLITLIKCPKGRTWSPIELFWTIVFQKRKIEMGPVWALNPPRNCPKCGKRVKAFFINLNLDQVTCRKFLFNLVFLAPTALWPSGSPFGDPGPHGELFFSVSGSPLGPHFFQGPHFLYFRLKNV